MDIKHLVYIGIFLIILNWAIQTRFSIHSVSSLWQSNPKIQEEKQKLEDVLKNVDTNIAKELSKNDGGEIIEITVPSNEFQQETKCVMDKPPPPTCPTCPACPICPKPKPHICPKCPECNAKPPIPKCQITKQIKKPKPQCNNKPLEPLKKIDKLDELPKDIPMENNPEIKKIDDSKTKSLKDKKQLETNNINKTLSKKDKKDKKYTNDNNKDNNNNNNNKDNNNNKKDIKEVFTVSNNIFSPSMSNEICKIGFNSRIATQQEVQNAYNNGGEWCSFGWSLDKKNESVAIYPLQKDTQTDICKGVKGLNGGYFDDKNRFGINCYGKKPDKNKNVVKIQDLLSNKNLILNPNDKKILEEYNKINPELNVGPFNTQKWSFLNSP